MMNLARRQNEQRVSRLERLDDRLETQHALLQGFADCGAPKVLAKIRAKIQRAEREREAALRYHLDQLATHPAGTFPRPPINIAVRLVCAAAERAGRHP